MMDEMDAMLARTPADILEEAYEHIKQRRQIELGLYTTGDLLALILLDGLQQTFNAYPFLDLAGLV